MNLIELDFSKAIENSALGKAKDSAKYAEVLKTEEYQRFIKGLKAKRLDQPDACNIIDPSEAVAPNGCHYSLNDIEYTLRDYPDFNTDAVFSILSQVAKYAELPANAKKIDLSDKALITWAIDNNINVNNDYKRANGIAVPVNSRTVGTAPSAESVEAAKSQRVSQPTDAVKQLVANSVARLGLDKAGLGTGFQIIPKGKDTVEVIKLPRGKTPCEPIYPDFIEVGDTVPEWVFSQTYAQVRNEIKSSTNIPTLTDATSNERQKQLAAVEKEIEEFKDKQLAKWIQRKGLKYSNDEEKVAALTEYNRAIVEDKEHFIDGIYIADSSDKGIYEALIRRKNELSDDIGTNLDEKTKKREEEKKKKATDKSEEKKEEDNESDDTD